MRTCASLGDTWEWDGVSWQPGETGPAARFDGAMAFDPVRAKAVLFGGIGPIDSAGTLGPLSDTWELERVGWSSVRTTAAPPRRAGAAMAYDGNVHGVVMLGGYTKLLPPPVSNAYGDSWVFDGSEWREVTDALGPVENRFFAGLVHDDTRRRTILFSGQKCADCIAMPGTWEWDGASWLLRGPSGQFPVKKVGGAAAFDTARRRVVFVIATLTEFQTWEYSELAGPCSTEADCDTARCSGGVCCAVACGQCSECDFTGVACTPIRRRDDPTACTGDRSCNGDAVCGKKLGQACAVAGDCVSGFCAGQVCCEVEACAPYACGVDGKCLSACTGAHDCADGWTCDVAAHACVRLAGTCEGAVAIAHDGTRRDCSPYACAPAGCITTCGSSDDCADGFSCSGDQTCVATRAFVPPGCATNGGDGGGLGWMGLAAALVAWAGWRRRAR